MDQKKLLLFRVNTIIFLLLVERGSCVDKHFEACEPSSCGKGPNISYPFWISGKQVSFCGFTGAVFDLSCNDNEPIIILSGDNYIIRNISYEDESLWVSKAGLSNDICSLSMKNLTLDDSPFNYSGAGVDVVFFFHCIKAFPEKYAAYSIDCTGGDLSPHSLVFFRDDPLLDDVKSSNTCNTSVIIPLENIKNLSSDSELSKELIVKGLDEGFHMRWHNVANCGECHTSGGRCGFDDSEYKFMCYCPDHVHANYCKTGKALKKVIIYGIVVGIILTVGTIIYCYLRRKSITARTLWQSKAESAKAVEAFLKDCALLTPKRYKYKDVKKMTSAFKDKIGEGGYGSVFKGMLPDGNMVAVKILSEKKGNGNDFINEVASISRTSHVNIVTLIGFCVEEPKRALVYEFMPNGSLEKFIFEGTPSKTHHQLCWETLYKIAIGIARGLEYLHRGCGTRIVHFDIKPHNILLDKNFNPKIADFGLSKLCHATESVVSMTRARGTAGYIAPEVVSRNFGVVSHKSDVYSYGMMVLEMVGGRRNIDVGVSNISEIYFPHWVYKRLNLNEDLSLHGVTSLEDQEIAQKMILVGLWCIQIDPQNRPPMSRVLDMLAGRLEDLEIPPNPFPSSPLTEEVS